MSKGLLHRRRMLMQLAGGGGVLPSGYTQANFVIKNTANATPIDIGIPPSYSNKYEIEVQVRTPQTKPFQAWFDPIIGYNVQDPRFFSLTIFTWNEFCAGVFYNNTPSALFFIDIENYINSSFLWKVKYENNVVTSDLEGMINSGTIATMSVPNSNMCLFIGHGQNGKVGYGIGVLTIKLNDILVRYLIPCTRDSDSLPGFYDIVNDVFHHSAAGNFIAE